MNKYFLKNKYLSASQNNIFGVFSLIGFIKLNKEYLRSVTKVNFCKIVCIYTDRQMNKKILRLD